MEPFVIFILSCLAYFTPTMSARRGRRGSVFVINLFFGWTMIGWVVALWMAVRSRELAKEAV